MSSRYKLISAQQWSITLIPSISILVAMVLVSALFHVSIPRMTRDVAVIAHVHPLTGIISNLGILLWSATASICGFAAMTLRNVVPRSKFWFLACSALLSAYLLFDDFFLFHDDLASRFFGLNEKVVVSALGIAVFGYGIAFRRVILQTEFGMFLLAIGFLTASVVIDELFGSWLLGRVGHWKYLFEDGPKWLGIASWCSYYVHTCHQLLVSSLVRSRESSLPAARPSSPG